MNIAGISKHGSCCMEEGNGRSCRAESVVMSEIGWGVDSVLVLALTSVN